LVQVPSHFDEAVYLRCLRLPPGMFEVALRIPSNHPT
jgi:hypothetical protein